MLRDLLLDTHILLWMATDPDRIPVSMLEAISDANRRLVSHVSAIEIQLKNLNSPKAFPFSLRNLEQAMKEYSCTELPLTYQDIDALGNMQFLHRDPFDRLLMAQSRHRDVPLVTLDEDILRTCDRYKAFPLFNEDRRNPPPPAS